VWQGQTALVSQGVLTACSIRFLILACLSRMHEKNAWLSRYNHPLRSGRRPLDCAVQQGGEPPSAFLGRFLPKLGGASWHRLFFVLCLAGAELGRHVRRSTTGVCRSLFSGPCSRCSCGQPECRAGAVPSHSFPELPRLAARALGQKDAARGSLPVFLRPRPVIQGKNPSCS
jgi:hypothetical protein